MVSRGHCNYNTTALVKFSNTDKNIVLVEICSLRDIRCHVLDGRCRNDDQMAIVRHTCVGFGQLTVAMEMVTIMAGGSNVQ